MQRRAQATHSHRRVGVQRAHCAGDAVQVQLLQQALAHSHGHRAVDGEEQVSREQHRAAGVLIQSGQHAQRVRVGGLESAALAGLGEQADHGQHLRHPWPQQLRLAGRQQLRRLPHVAARPVHRFRRHRVRLVQQR